MNGAIQQANKPKENPMLTQIVDNATKQVPAKLKDQFERIMIVGSKMMWSDEMTEDRQEFDQLMQAQQSNVPEVVTHTVLKICSIIQNESGVKKPLDAMGIAAPIFMAHILQYVEAKLRIPVTNDLIDQTGQMLQVNLLKMYNVSEQMIQELLKGRGGQPGEQAAAPVSETEPADEGAPPAGESATEGSERDMVPVNVDEEEADE